MRERILIVDDEESIRYTFEQFLIDEGYEVESASNVPEALESAAKISFDLIFTDIILTGGSGIEILQRAKELSPLCPVIMITGAPDVESASAAVRLGAYDYITKPIRRETLIRIARMALRHSRLAHERERERRNIEAILRSVKDGIITVDKEFVISTINEAVQGICGFQSRLVGQHLTVLSNQCSGRCAKALEEAYQKNKNVELHRIECDNAEQNSLIVTLTASPLKDEKGEPAGAVLVIRDETRLAVLERDTEAMRRFHGMVGQSEQMQQVFSLIENLAEVPATALITGESGTGKELAAQAIHEASARSGASFVKVNCAALPETLLESELFGHVKGAFTGAVTDRKGRFEMADGGTIFLDEIGDISPAVQQRLLRVLQEREVDRLGDTASRKVDVRVITATNKDLAEKVRLGQFRDDLYYRLNVVELKMPSLRDRKIDIPLLISCFIDHFNVKFRRHIQGVTDEVTKLFLRYDWPGNVRELQHAIEHAFVFCRTSMITIDSLPAQLKNLAGNNNGVSSQEAGSDQRESIMKALTACQNNKTKAARLLGISRRTFYRKLDEYGIAGEL